MNWEVKKVRMVLLSNGTFYHATIKALQLKVNSLVFILPELLSQQDPSMMHCAG